MADRADSVILLPVDDPNGRATVRKSAFVANATLAVLVFCAGSVCSEVCKYIDPVGNMHYTNQQPERGWTVVACGAPEDENKGNPSKPVGLIYPDTVNPIFEKEDEPSAKNGYKKCEVSIAMNANAKAEFLNFRAKILTDGLCAGLYRFARWNDVLARRNAG